MFLRIHLFNDNAYINQFHIYNQLGQEKIELGVSGKGIKRDREKQINGVRDRVLQIFGNSVGYKRNIVNGHPSISNQ